MMKMKDIIDIGLISVGILGLGSIFYMNMYNKTIDDVVQDVDTAISSTVLNVLESREIFPLVQPLFSLQQFPPAIINRATTTTTATASAPTNKPLTYTFTSKFGSKGTGPGQFQDPHDVSFDAQDNIFIPDRARNNIQVFTHDGKYLKTFGGPGSGPVQFNVPYSVAHDAANNFWVSDRENNRMQKMTNTGTFITELKTINGMNLKMPEDLTFDFVDGSMYIADTGNNRILKLDKNQKFLLQWGSKGAGDGQFDHPHSINLGPDRNVYVSCGFQPYIQKFSPQGKFIMKWGSEGKGDGQMLMFLEHMDIDRWGRLHLINNNIRPVVQVWDLNGKFLTKYGTETEGSADGQFREPEHVTIDRQGKSFVVDAKNQRVQIFTPSYTGTPLASESIVRNLMINEPYNFNGYYGRRRL